MPVIATRRRCFLLRFLRSYDGSRACFGRWQSVKDAFKVARS